MGATFEEITLGAMGPHDMGKAFDEIIRQCEWESGHGGYSGTFAEKRGYGVRLLDTEKPVDLDTARELVKDTAEKWGPALAVKLEDGRWFIGARCSK